MKTFEIKGQKILASSIEAAQHVSKLPTTTATDKIIHDVDITGKRVLHELFGTGNVDCMSGKINNAACVKFDDGKIKTILVSKLIEITK